MSRTIVAISTGLQPSAIGVIRMSGDDALKIAERAVCKALPDRVAVYAEVKDADGRVLDRAVCTAFYAPRSYTGENMAEISCHGGMVVLQSVVARLCELGAVPAERGEFTKRAFLGGKMDLSQSEAVIDVITAKSPLSVKEAFSQMSGSIRNRIERLRDTLCDIDSEIMAYVDFSAEGIDAPDGAVLARRIGQVRDEAAALSATYGAGQIIKEGYPVCLCGKPNVGKSSIMNALVGSDRSIVTAAEGTTRDVITETVDIGGLAVLLSDTAGIRDAENEVEKIGVERARQTIRGAGLILCIFDGSAPLDENDINLCNLVKGENAVAVINKCDLESRADKGVIESAFETVIHVSAKQGLGLDALSSAIKNAAFKGVDMSFEGVTVTSLRHKKALDAAVGFLDSAYTALSQSVDPEICEIDIAAALSALGEITGDSVRDDMIDKIFENFCVGK